MIIIKSENEIVKIREAGKIVYLTHQELIKHIQPGITTGELDRVAEKVIRSYGAFPSFLGYRGFPGSICASVNEELVHGIPGKRKLQEGDIISIDIGACHEGYHGDSAWTYPVGKITSDARNLLDVTQQSLFEGLDQVKPDARIGDISHAIQLYAERKGFSVVQEYTGHGIGSSLHEEPPIPNYGFPGKGPRLKQGMVLAIEPMLNLGERFVHTLEDEWTVVTSDSKICAHFEHTVVVTDKGYEILTGPS